MHKVRHCSAVCAFAFFSMLIPLPAKAATTLQLPASARLTQSQVDKSAEQRFPVSVYAEQETRFLALAGQVSLQAYTLASTSLTTLQMLTPLRDQLEAEGFRGVFACADSVCGGFDFRFTMDLLPEPAMHVDLGNFQYFIAQHDDGRVAAVITSSARTSGFIHITSVTPPAAGGALVVEAQLPDIQNSLPLTSQQSPQADLQLDAIVDTLQRHGSVVLDDLAFGTGTSSLDGENFASLTALADYLKTTPSAKVVLVGHTDAMGSLSGNISLSRKRAAAVRTHLISTHSVPPEQISAEGIGYLAPRASNENEAGRKQNRRVEAVLASTL